MKPVVARALNQMKLKVRKHNEKYKVEIADFREHPEKFEEKDDNVDDDDNEDDDDEDSDEDESSEDDLNAKKTTKKVPAKVSYGELV